VRVRGSSGSIVGVASGLLAAAVVCPSGAGAQPGRQMSAAVFMARVRSGPVRHAEIVGDVLLGGSKHAITCTDCTFDGNVASRGPDVRGPVDLAGSTFEGIVDFRGVHFGQAFDVEGATFRAPALFGPPAKPMLSDPPHGHTEFAGTADFSLARFAQVATFDRAWFDQRTDFRFARFGTDTVFSYASVSGAIAFDRAAFAGSAEFAGATFDGPGSFAGVELNGPVDFSLANFEGHAIFDYAHFGRDAAFLYTSFDGGGSFVGIDAAGGLDFAHSTITETMDFDNARSARTVSFADAEFDPHGTLTLNDASLGGLLLGVHALLQHVDPLVLGNRKQDLSLLDATARARDDLGLANDAHYNREVLHSAHMPWYWRPFNIVGYRYGAGYFVRPLNPVLILCVLAAGFALWRTYRASRHPHQLDLDEVGRDADARPAARPAFRFASAFVSEWGKTLLAVIPGKGSATETYGAELVVYRVLGACALVGFANTNPTLRQMFDALR
jgi:pentapeptide repeat protein